MARTVVMRGVDGLSVQNPTLSGERLFGFVEWSEGSLSIGAISEAAADRISSTLSEPRFNNQVEVGERDDSWLLQASEVVSAANLDDLRSHLDAILAAIQELVVIKDAKPKGFRRV